MSISSVARQRTISEKAGEDAEAAPGLSHSPSMPTMGVSRSMTAGTTLTSSTELGEMAVFTRSWRRFLRKGKRKIGLKESLRNFAFASVLNILLIFIPIAWASHLVTPMWSAETQFALCFIALLPLAKLLEFGGEQMAFYTGKDIGDFIAVTLNNAIEATLAIILLLKCELRLLQSTIIGIVSLHLLLIPGFAFFTGGARIMEQELHPHLAQLNHTLLTIGVLTLLLPAAFFAAGGNLSAISPVSLAAETTSETVSATGEATGEALSSAVEATATAVSEAAAATGEAVVRAIRAVGGAVIRRAAEESGSTGVLGAADEATAQHATSDALLQMSRGLAILLLLVYLCSRVYLHDPPGDEDNLHQHKDAPQELKEEELRLATVDPEVSQWVCIPVMVVCLALMAVTAEFLVDSVEGLGVTQDPSGRRSLSGLHEHEEWFGLILLPLVSFSADGVVAVIRFISHQLGRHEPPTTMAKAQAIDLSVQFLLFWLPFLVLLGWWTDKPLSLLFDLFEVAVIIGACFIVNYVTADAKTNYAEGFAMVAFYFMIAVCAWFYNGQVPIKEFLRCPGQELE